MTLWGGRVEGGLAPAVWEFLRADDEELLPYDVKASAEHARRLQAAGVLTVEELAEIEAGLARISASGPEDEDVHSAIERQLGAVGRKLHAGRSRNDQVAAAFRLYVEDACAEASAGIDTLALAVLDRAEAEAATLMPGYTHLQRAQPVYLSHHLLAYVWMLLRDRERFLFAERAASVLPLGAGALAGTNFDTDRRLVAERLGFDAVAPNSIDAVSNRDFVLDFLAAASTCATHLSRLGAEIVLWSSEEFGFLELPDAWSSGSSIMPQKKNPDAAELLRAKAPRVVGHLAALHGVLHALPLTYNKDLQEDKEHLFDAVDTLDACLEAARGMLEGVTFRRARLAAAAADEFLAATDVADLLVRRGVPFRESHGVVAGLVRRALEDGVALSDLPRETLAEHSDVLDEEFYAVLAQGAWLESKVSEGGTALARVREQLASARGVLEAPSG